LRQRRARQARELGLRLATARHVTAVCLCHKITHFKIDIIIPRQCWADARPPQGTASRQPLETLTARAGLAWRSAIRPAPALRASQKSRLPHEPECRWIRYRPSVSRQ
jgi:hypothetical protein